MRVIYNADKSAVSYEWGSFDEWYDEFKVWAQTPFGASEKKKRDYGSGLSWFGHAGGFDACLKAIDSGWSEKREQLLKLMEGVELELPVYPSMTTMRRRKRKWMDEGDEFSQERAWAGQLDTCWSKPVRTERMLPNTKRVTLAFDVSDNGCVQDSQAMWRAALSLLLCDSLIKAGRIFEVWCIDSTTRPFAGYSAPRTLWSGWMVKGSGDPLVLDRLAGMLGVGFLRTVGFMGQSMGPHEAASGLGGALHQGLPSTLAERRKAGEVVIRVAGCYSKSDALARYKEAWQEVEAASGVGNQEEVATYA